MLKVLVFHYLRIMEGYLLSENQTSQSTLHPVSERELRYDRLGTAFRFLERFLDDENQIELDGLLWSLADRVRYNDEGA